MSRLALLTSLTALALFGGGASGLALTRPEPAPAAEPDASAHAVAPAEPRPIGAQAPDRRLRLAPGESLTEALIRGGSGGLDAALADSALADVTLPAAAPLKIWLGSPLPGGARLLDRLEIRAEDNLVMALTRSGERYAVERRRVAIDDTPVRLRLEGGRPLDARLATAGLSETTRLAILQRAGPSSIATVDLIVAHEEIAGEGEFGPLLYLALTLPGGEVRRWLGNEQGGLELIGESVVPAGLARPVPGPVSSAMGLRIHPVLRFLRWHRGTDFAAPAGTPVRAAATGRVVEAGWRGGYGKLVRVAHEDGTLTAYAHLSRIDAQPGERIERGAILGLVGETGLTTGPHLHFEWLRDGRPLTPAFAPAAPVNRPLDEATLMALRSLLAAPYREPPAGRS